MDALKRAERTKQGDDAGSTGQPASVAPSRDLAAELGIAAAAPAAAQVAAVNSAPTELSLTPLGNPAPALQAAAQPAAALSSRERTPAAPRGAQDASQAADRLAAKSVFAAKKPAAGASRKPLYALVGLLLALGAGGAAYVWMQVQPATSMPVVAQAPVAAGTINPAAVALPRSEEAAPTVGTKPDAAAPPPAGVVAQPAAREPAVSASAPSGRPSAALPPTRVEPPGTERGVAGTTMPPREPTLRKGADAAIAQGGVPIQRPSNMQISRDRPAATIDPAVTAGYAALVAGQIEVAREHYARALGNDASSRDALLGMAAVAARSGRTDVADGLYQRVLEFHPRDAFATAQLAAARGGDAATESRVRSVAAEQKDPIGAAPLQFTLGNQMAAQARWPEAQHAYFAAFAAEPDNPDFCYNLAVSLDHMRQIRQARDYYSRALELSQKRGAAFDAAQARTRVEQLTAAMK